MSIRVRVLSITVELRVFQLIEACCWFYILSCFVSIKWFELLETLREINVDSAFVDKRSFHFKVGFLARFFCFEFDEGVL